MKIYLLSLLIVSGFHSLMSPISGRPYSPIPMTGADRELTKMERKIAWLQYTEWLLQDEKVIGCKAPKEWTEADDAVFWAHVELSVALHTKMMPQQKDSLFMSLFSDGLDSSNSKLQKLEKESGLKAPTTDLQTLLQEIKTFQLQRNILFYTNELKNIKEKLGVSEICVNDELDRCKKELEEAIQRVGITPPENCTAEEKEKLSRQSSYMFCPHRRGYIMNEGIKLLVICDSK